MKIRIATFAAALAGLLPAAAAQGGDMKADEARRFVIGKMFRFQCFDGSTGAGRIHADGSVVGTIQLRGQGPVRMASLPAGTLRVKGEAVCASVRGLPFQPCFDLQKTSAVSFRGAVSGFSFASCSFTRMNARVQVANTSRRPLPILSALRTGRFHD